MFVKMNVCPNMQFREDDTFEITINSEAIGAFVPVIETGSVTGKNHIACYAVCFMQGFAYGASSTGFYVTIEEKEKMEKILKPQSGLKPNLAM